MQSNGAWSYLASYCMVHNSKRKVEICRINFVFRFIIEREIAKLR